MADVGQTVNVPQLLAFMLISALAIRYFFFSASSSAAGTQPSRATHGPPPPRTVDERQIAQLQAMFPQLSRRELAWDLMRNGGSVQATSERMLTGRGLEAPPQSFQPPPPPEGSGTSATAAPQPQQQQAQKPTHPDLITRYGLTSKVSSEEMPATSSSTSTPKSWSQSKTERQQLLQRRREQMILDARRKLEEKERGKEATGGGLGRGHDLGAG
ncbi:MAG: hypothetical protein M1832_006465 [Thelocarpon impressellum]|nr:MAG: hypothetical protein M1832_006465 [Thelocarpon impressellum]